MLLHSALYPSNLHCCCCYSTGIRDGDLVLLLLLWVTLNYTLYVGASFIRCYYPTPCTHTVVPRWLRWLPFPVYVCCCSRCLRFGGWWVGRGWWCHVGTLTRWWWWWWWSIVAGVTGVVCCCCVVVVPFIVRYCYPLLRSSLVLPAERSQRSDSLFVPFPPCCC